MLRSREFTYAFWLVVAASLILGAACAATNHDDMPTSQCKTTGGHVVTHGDLRTCVDSTEYDTQTWKD